MDASLYLYSVNSDRIFGTFVHKLRFLQFSKHLHYSTLSLIRTEMFRLVK